MRLLLLVLFLGLGLNAANAQSAISTADEELIEAFAFLLYGNEEGEKSWGTTRRFSNRNSIRYESVFPNANFGSTAQEHKASAGAKFSRQDISFYIQETCTVKLKYSLAPSKGDSLNQFEAADASETTYHLNRITRMELDVLPGLNLVRLRLEGPDFVCDSKGCQNNTTPIIVGLPGLDGPSSDTEDILQRRQKAVGVIKKYCPGRQQ